MAADSHSKTPAPPTACSVCDKAAVLAQMERILGSVAFRNSKRYSSLLRHLVEKTLEGGCADLRERSLGVDVFGRPADYDNYTDPIVRISAGEVRKRIAKYYHEPGREREIRIELPLGSYVPEFVPPEEPAAISEPPPVAVKPGPDIRRFWPVLAGVVLLLSAVLLWRPWSRGAMEAYWQPFLARSSTVTICVARAPAFGTLLNADRPPVIAWADSSTSTKLACLLNSAGQSYELRRDDDLNFEEIRQGPAILIGAFNDVWTMRLMENLRFEFRQDGRVRWVSDRVNPSSRAWSLDSSPGTRMNRDYAIISRLLHPRTGKPVLAIAGLWGHGTAVAGEFVTNRSFLEALARRAPAGWQNRNLQVVIGTELIDDHPGPPTILALHVW